MDHQLNEPTPTSKLILKYWREKEKEAIEISRFGKDRPSGLK
jgi:hypothetical protein